MRICLMASKITVLYHLWHGGSCSGRRKYLIEFTNGEIFLCDKVVNSAGLWADKIAKAAGMDILSLGLVPLVQGIL